MRYIARLKYTDRAAFEADFIAKELLIEQEGELVNSPKVNAIVELGILQEQTGAEEDGTPIFTALDGYHVDVDLKEYISFGEAITTPNTPSHGVRWAAGATIITD